MTTGDEWVETDAEDLDREELAAALQESAVDCSWGYQAAVSLIVEQRNWLHHAEFLEAVDAGRNRHGRLFACVNWADVDMTAPASSGELRLMEIARSLAGNTQHSAIARPADRLRRRQPRPGSAWDPDRSSGASGTRKVPSTLQQASPRASG